MKTSVFQASRITRQKSHVTRHTSNATRHTSQHSRLTLLPIHCVQKPIDHTLAADAGNVLHVTRQRQTSHVTWHTSHMTRQMSHWHHTCGHPTSGFPPHRKTCSSQPNVKPRNTATNPSSPSSYLTAALPASAARAAASKLALKPRQTPALCQRRARRLCPAVASSSSPSESSSKSSSSKSPPPTPPHHNFSNLQKAAVPPHRIPVLARICT